MPTSAPVIVPAVEQALDTALSTPVEDSVYPEVGDPRIDALLYDLDLDWDPDARRLEASAIVTFRAARTAPRFQLDLGPELTVGQLELDGEPVGFARRGKDLVVKARIEADQRYELTLDYVGTPEPADAPTTRQDFSTTGFTITDTGEVWTMQEPFGAYTWYPVNDQPSDKALYDVTIHAPMPWTGISNGHLTELTDDGETTTSSWQLTEPASSYLVTLAIGDYDHSATTTAGGLRVDHWTPRGKARVAERVQTAAASVDWIEGKLGPYPFDSLGLVVTDSHERDGDPDDGHARQQRLRPLAAGDRARARPPVVRRPGVAGRLERRLAQRGHDDADAVDVRGRARHPPAARRRSRTRAPPTRACATTTARPGRTTRSSSAASNIYYTPGADVERAARRARRRRVLPDRPVVAGPSNDNTSVTRDQIFEHWETETGRELSDFFAALDHRPTHAGARGAGGLSDGPPLRARPHRPGAGRRLLDVVGHRAVARRDQ